MTTFRSTNAKERFIYHTAGLDGTGSGSYIDDVVLCDADMNSGWTSAADSTKEVRRTYLQNWRHDIVVVLDASGRLLENVKYLSYGTPFACPAGDTELKGSWQSSDSTRISSYAGSYDIRFDPTHNGVIDAADITYANSIKSGYQTLGLGVLSSTAVANRKGYAGYEHAPELAGTKWHVRNRVLDAELGRWTRRDPMGYHDGPNLYPYVFSSPYRM